MKEFMGKDFLLSNDTAKTLYHNYAEKMPILDYHCHIPPEDIATDKKYENITQLWLNGDHYKWRLMRANGVDEYYITGEASDFEKFQKWADTLPKAIGNPLYHWSHLELRKYFGYEGILNGETALKVWNLCLEKLKDSSFSARNLIKKSNVTLICTTDDPIDILEWHKAIASDDEFDVQVLPAFRPDKAMNIEQKDYMDYLHRLSQVTNIEINSYQNLKEALSLRIDFFDSMGCKVSDHGMETVMYEPATDIKIEQIYAKCLAGQTITTIELLQFKTAFMLFVAQEYYKHGWVMQLHYGTKRNNNSLMYGKIGPDTGYDCMNGRNCAEELSNFLNTLTLENKLPKTMIYSLNPNDNATIGTIIGCFQDSSAIGKLQQGSAWWFNDHKAGMTEQLTTYSSLGILGNFNGMLTDSRSFLSYTRHEYFRRILCNLIGTWVENGEYPKDLPTLGELISNISYNNCIRYFNFNLDTIIV